MSSMIKELLEFIETIPLNSTSIRHIENFVALLSLSGSFTRNLDFDLNTVQEALIERSPDNPPYELPTHWKWSTVGDVCNHQAGKALNSRNTVGNLMPYLSTANVQDGFFVLDHIKEMYFRDDEEFEKYSIQTNDVLVLEGGSVGRTAIWEGESGIYAIQNHLHRLRPVENIAIPEYIELVLRTAYRLGHSSDMGKGIAIQGLSAGKLKSLPFPLPPIEEQSQIIEVLEIFSQVIESVKTEQYRFNVLHSKLQNSSHIELANSTTPTEISSAIKRITGNNGMLLSNLEGIANLRHSIRNLAVKGQFLSNEENLNTRIVRVGDYVSFLNGYAFKSGWYHTNGIKVLRNKNISPTGIDWGEVKWISTERAAEYERFRLNEGDIVLSLDRPLISTGLKVARVTAADLPCLLLQRVGCPRSLSEEISMDYFLFWLKSPEFVDTIRPGRSLGVPHISTKAVENMRMTLPSTNGQQLTLQIANNLINLCDQLETRIEEIKRRKPIC